MDFRNYLKAQNKRNIRQILCYAQRFGSILETGDVSPLINLQSSGTVRRHAMESLTALSKYLGCYDQWQDIRKRYSLHWTSGDESIKSLQRFFDQSSSLDRMIETVKEMMRILPKSMALVIRHAILTGLRPSEACESVRLLKNSQPGLQQYYNPERQILQHYLYPEIFLRATKKAYISYITLDNLHPIANLSSKTPSWNAIRHACRSRNINMEMRLCRKIFASYLRQSGIQSEVVNLLQGRVDSDILTRHYLMPSSSLKDQVLDAVKELQNMID
jgi:hypothetical protein